MRINRVHLMRSLTLKLTLAFLLVGLTGSIVVALSVRLQTQQRFNQFVVRMDSSEIVANLLTYYEKNGSWDGVQKGLVGVGPTTGSGGEPHRSEPFPITVVEMISVAEESNTLDNVLIEIADGLEKQTKRRLDLAVRLLEPILLLFLAGAVLCVVIALLMPVIKMSSTI